MPTPSRVSASTPPQQSSAPPADSFTFSEPGVGEKLAMFGLASAVGGVGIGVPTGLAMGSVKSFLNGSFGLGIGLGVAAAASVPTVGLFGMGMLAMTSDGGSSFGVNSGLVGGALVTAATGYALFG